MVGAALKRDSVPRRAIRKAREQDIIALSRAVFAEIDEVLQRPRFVRYIIGTYRQEVLALRSDAAVWVEPGVRVTDCRDAKDNMYLELALAAQAEIIVSSDGDLLTLDPWRGVRIMRPADYVAAA